METFKKYQHYVKIGGKGIGYIIVGLFSGFILYWVRYRKQLSSGENIEKKADKKIIPVDKLEKIIKKIKNTLTHNMVMMYDLSHAYNPEEFKDKDDIEIEDIKMEEIQLNGEFKTEFNTSKTSDKHPKFKDSENRINTFQREFKPLVENIKFRNEKLLDYEISKIKHYGYEPDEYYESLKIHNKNEKIKNDVKFIADFKSNLDQDKLMKINFSDNLTNNYLKIISNIYYLNLRKTQKKFKDEFLDSGVDFKSNSEISSSFNDIYKSFLKHTRNEVLTFFNVTDSNELSLKTMLRIFPYYYSPYHSMRVHYEKINQEVNALIKKIQMLGSIDELYNDSHPDAIIKPVDKLIEFTNLLKINNSVDTKIETKTEDRKSTNKRILDKYDEVYSPKKATEELD